MALWGSGRAVKTEVSLHAAWDCKTIVQGPNTINSHCMRTDASLGQHKWPLSALLSVQGVVKLCSVPS